jgi:hypothetical protein
MHKKKCDIYSNKLQFAQNTTALALAEIHSTVNILNSSIKKYHYTKNKKNRLT